MRIAQDAIASAERGVENVQARVREARKRLGHATITAPFSGYVTERLVHPAQHVPLGGQVLTIARLDEYEVRIPIYDFEEFKRLKTGLAAFVTVGKTEFGGTIERLGATTQTDRWGRTSNFAVIRFKGNGTLGLLGLNADVRIVLPPRGKTGPRHGVAQQPHRPRNRRPRIADDVGHAAMDAHRAGESPGLRLPAGHADLAAPGDLEKRLDRDPRVRGAVARVESPVRFRGTAGACTWRWCAPWTRCWVAWRPSGTN